MDQKNKWIILLIVVLALGGTVFAYNQRVANDEFSQEDATQTEQTENQNKDVMEHETETDQVATPQTEAPTESMSAPTAGADSENLKKFTITASNFKFNPSEIKVKKGDVVQITFINQSGFHDLVIDGYAVKTARLATGGQEIIGFTANKTGTFEIYCSVGSHRAMGMVGTLIVE